MWVAPDEGPRGAGAPPSEALLWLGWVAGRLGWRVEGPAGENEWRLRRENRSALAAVRLGPLADVPAAATPAGHAAAGELLAARLSARDPSISFTLTRGPGEECATQIVATEGACPLPRVVRLPRAPRARLLAAALSEPRRDRLYPEALAIAARLAA